MTEDYAQLTANVTELLDRVAERKEPCKGCGVQLWFVRHRNNALAPYDFKAQNHFIGCPKREEFKRR